LTTVAGLPNKAAHHLYHGAEALASKAFKGAGDLTQAAHRQGDSLWHKAIQHGQKVFNGAVDYVDQHKNQVAMRRSLLNRFRAGLTSM
jgi:cell division septum initiation protein DivIVA